MRKINFLIYLSYSERLFMQMADLLVSEGYAAAGYEYINGKSWNKSWVMMNKLFDSIWRCFHVK